MGIVRYVVVHHSATDSTATIDDIRRVHRDDRGWDDIGYHWIVNPRGEILRGRPEHDAGAHCKGLNESSIGICCIGNFDEHEPSEAMVEALVFCATDVCNRYLLSADDIIGHGDAHALTPTATVTRCPGKNLFDLLPRVRSRVAQYHSSIVLSRGATFVTKEYKEAFKSNILIHNASYTDDGLLSVEGIVKNAGRSSWDNSNCPDNESFRLGYRIVIPDTGKKLSEGRRLFPKPLVKPGESLPFAIVETLPRGAHAPHIMVEIEVLKESQFWFSDLGNEPYRMLLVPAGLFSRPLFGVQVELFSAKNMKDYVVLSGELVNVGRTQVPDGTILEAICTSSGMQPVQVTEEVQKLPTLDKTSFQLVIPGMLLADRVTVNLNVKLSNRQIISTRAVEIHLCAFHGKLTDLPFEAAAVTIDAIKSIVRGIYKVTGVVKNIGILSWIGVQETQYTPVRVGAVLYGPQGPFWEGRYELVRPNILPGEEFTFSFLIRAFTEEAMQATLRIDVVKERCYWFSTKAPSLVEVPIQTVRIADSASVSLSRTFHAVSSPEEVHMLVIAPKLPLFDKETGGKRLYSMLKRFRKEGLRITYLYEGAENDKEIQKYSRHLRDLGVKCFQSPSDFLSSYEGPPFTIAILGWYSVVNEYTDLVRVLFPSCRIVADSVDLHWVREQRGVNCGALSFSADALYHRKELEKKAYTNADEVWVVTEDDREALVKEIGDPRVKIVSNLTEPFDEFPIGGKGDGIIFVGGFTHPPNISSALFAHQVVTAWRKKSGMKVPLFIVGNVPPPEVEALHDGVLTIVTGFVEDLRPWYERSRIMIAPLRYGAGIKGKICDSIAYGVPVITGAIGNEGIHLKNEDEIFLAETEAEYCDALTKVYDTNFKPHRMAEKAMHRVLLRTGLERCWPVMYSSCVAPPVVVGIVTYKARALLEECLQSLVKNTNYRNVRVAVLLNGCEDGSYESAKKIARSAPFKIDIIVRDTNDFFVRPNNYIIGRYDQSDIVMVNNDIIFSDPEWLSELVDAAYSAPDIGAAGGLLLGTDGKVLEAGARISANGYGEQFGKGLEPDDPSVRSTRYVGFVSGALLFMRRDALRLCGFLDTNFHPMYYEDVEWQYRLHRVGLKTIYSPRVRATHAEGSSAGVDVEKGMKRYQEIHRKTFLDAFSRDDIEKLSTLS